MGARLYPAGSIDVSAWAAVSFLGMPKTHAAAVRRRIAAVRLYFEGMPLAEIRRRTGVHRQQLNIFLKRCFRAHPDGRQFGFRGCLMYARRRPYSRSAPSAAISKRAQFGHSGLFRALLERFPDIADKVVAAALETTRGRFAESMLRMDKLHQLFLRLCESVGIKKDEYPFNVQSQADRSFARWLKQELVHRNLRRALNATLGVEASKRVNHLDEAVRSGAVLLPFDLVEVDGYRVDTLMTIYVPAPGGGPPLKLVLERIWIIAVVDRASRAVLGYHVSLSRNYSAEDVLICLENAILPWRPRTLQSEGLHYPPDAGFPSGVISELAFAYWAKIAFDNAKANLSGWLWDEVTEKIGCVLSPGPVASPNTRPAIERLFRELAQNFFQRLPTTTGGSLASPQRRDPEATAIRYEVHLDEVLDLVDVAIATYNATPSSGRHGRSPLDYLRFSVAQKSFFIRQIPEDERASFSLATVRAAARVGGSAKSGESPYIRFLGVNYRSPKLSASRWLLREQVTLQCPSRDLRQIKVFLKNGEEFDTLTAPSGWAAQPHDLRVRRAILKCIGAGKIARRGMTDVVGEYIAYKRKQSFRKKKARNELAHAVRIRDRQPPPLAEIPSPPEPEIFTRTPPPEPKIKIRPFNF